MKITVLASMQYSKLIVHCQTVLFFPTMHQINYEDTFFFFVAYNQIKGMESCTRVNQELQTLPLFIVFYTSHDIQLTKRMSWKSSYCFSAARNNEAALQEIPPPIVCRCCARKHTRDDSAGVCVSDSHMINRL